MEWGILYAHFSHQVPGVLDLLSRLMWYGRRGEEGVSKVLEIVSKVGRQRE